MRLPASLFSVGDRVLIRGCDWAGKYGVITNTPGKCFNGWTVKVEIDGKDRYAGLADHQMEKA